MIEVSLTSDEAAERAEKFGRITNQQECSVEVRVDADDAEQTERNGGFLTLFKGGREVAQFVSEDWYTWNHIDDN